MQNTKNNILSQIRDEYGKLVYTYTCHNKECGLISNRIKRLKFSKIFLSGVSSIGLISTIFSDSKVISIIGSVLSVALFVITMLLNEETMADNLSSHKKTSDQLWLIRENYTSLLVEFDDLELSEIVTRREDLLIKTNEIYKAALQTSSKAYKQSQQALQKDEEQFFEDWEIDLMLPKALRKTNENRKELL